MRPRRARLSAVAVLLALIAAACGGDDSSPSAEPSDAGSSSSESPSADSGSADSSSGTDAAVPESLDFTAAQLGGGEFDAASIQGQDTVLWFWAPWCTVCRAEAPDVVEAAGELEGSVEVIGVAGRGEVAEMEQFIDDTGTGGLAHVVDDDGSIWSSFDVAAQPAFAFIDDSGEVEVFVGALGREALTERMQTLAAA